MEKSEVAVNVGDLEEKAEVSSLAESSKEMEAASNPDSGHLEKPAARKVEEGSSPKWSPKEITSYDSHASLLPKWKKIFLASCVFAVLLDPLFLYIPIINHDTSCLGVDDNLKITALILRSLTDLFYVMEIALQFYRSENCSGLISKISSRTLLHLTVFLEAFLPSNSEDMLALVHFDRHFSYSSTSADCWQDACGNRNDQCDRSFGCHDDHTFRNITHLNELCPISTPSTSSFDFGIYSTVLQSGLPGSTNYLQKFSNCFCWGLRNLSSLGSNLQPSINTWENLFVAFISVTGLLLFIYLIGNLQTYMQLDVARIEDHRHRMKLERNLEENSRELDLWLSKNGIPERSKKEIKSQMMKKVRLEIEENRDVDFENILSMIPLEVQDYVKDRMPLTRLKQVPTLHHMDGLVLKEICVLLKPMKYTKNEIIIREDDDSLKMMIFIVEGNIIIEKPNRPSSSRGAGGLYGEKLLTWPSRTSFPAAIPSANESVKAIGDVEALVLMASDMKDAGVKFGFHFKKHSILEEQLADLQTSIGVLTEYQQQMRFFTEPEMKKATRNFDERQKLGEETHGVVYLGTLPCNTTVAIQLCRRGIILQTDNSFDRMIQLSQINHRNVVRFLGCGIVMGSLALVHEYVGNGTLYDHIHKRTGKGPISWRLRMKMAVDSAAVLVYLHDFTSPPIIHGGLKTVDMLVDEKLTAKVSGFDASLLDEYYSTILRGAAGYLDPEFSQTECLTEKSDVYSFGVVLAELITSRTAFKEIVNEMFLY